MLQNEVVNYIQTTHVRKGCLLEMETLLESPHGYEVDIVMASSRFRKRIGRITGGATDLEDSKVVKDKATFEDGRVSACPPDVLQELFHSVKVRKTEQELLQATKGELLLRDWLNQGWLMRKVDYERDGKTVKWTSYLMGYELYKHLQQKKSEAQGKQERRIAEWMNRLQTVLGQSADGCLAVPQGHFLRSFAEQLCQALAQGVDLSDVGRLGLGNAGQWRVSKLELYLDFIVALTEIASVKPQFDWKEIGARYYREIGGSKRFDPYKEAFLEALEQNLGCPPQLIGLSSVGTITPVYFAGELKGAAGIVYPHGFLHATTDWTIFQTVFFSSCRNLWLVENRAALTRMVAEERFLQETSSLVIGLDGQLRSGQRKLIMDVLTHSAEVEQVLVWCDSDRAGLVISGHVHELVQAAGCKVVKWLLPTDGRSDSTGWKVDSYTWEMYEAEMRTRLTEHVPVEQEAQMGGREEWIRWLNA